MAPMIGGQSRRHHLRFALISADGTNRAAVEIETMDFSRSGIGKINIAVTAAIETANSQCREIDEAIRLTSDESFRSGESMAVSH